MIAEDTVLNCCHVCGESKFEIVPGYEMFSQVTSDCKPWPAGSRLAVCQSCACVQKGIDRKWKADAVEIYGNYSIYHQSGGTEQAVFDKDSGHISARSKKLLECLESNISLPEEGRILDVGCGNGSFLRTFAGLFPKWAIAGTEYDERHRKVIESITNNSSLYTCPIEEIDGTFDLIIMLHILEHVLDPVTFLRNARNKLRGGGFLVIDVPNYLENPFDLLIADHCTHFTPLTLTTILKKAGLNIVVSAADWVPKEISVVAGMKMGCFTELKDMELKSVVKASEAVITCLQWLESLRQVGKDISAKGNFGIFGTSIAATWLCSEIGEAVSFFVDEDPQRIGKTFMGRPVLHPQGLQKGSHIFLALPLEIARHVFRRLSSLDIELHLPPLLKIQGSCIYK